MFTNKPLGQFLQRYRRARPSLWGGRGHGRMVLGDHNQCLASTSVKVLEERRKLFFCIFFNEQMFSFLIFKFYKNPPVPVVRRAPCTNSQRKTTNLGISLYERVDGPHLALGVPVRWGGVGSPVGGGNVPSHSHNWFWIFSFKLKKRKRLLIYCFNLFV